MVLSLHQWVSNPLFPNKEVVQGSHDRLVFVLCIVFIILKVFIVYKSKKDSFLKSSAPILSGEGGSISGQRRRCFVQAKNKKKKNRFAFA